MSADMPAPPDATGIGAVSALNDPVRRRLYDYVRGQRQGVGREQAATATGLSTHTARFHLDKLVEVGLLAVEFRRLTGRSGPGAGRPAKIYSAAQREVAVSIPPRHYDLVGRLLAAAVERSLSGEPLADALVAEAHDAGRRDGQVRTGDTFIEGEGEELDRVGAVLSELGYQPRADAGGLVLSNCPFDSLVGDHPELVCGVNRDYVTGLVEGMGCCHTQAVLDPAAGRCCVRVSPAQSGPADPTR